MAYRGSQRGRNLRAVGPRARAACQVVFVLAVGLAGCGREELDLGDRLMAQGKSAQAIAAWQRELAGRPRDTDLLIRIATAQARLKQFGDAEATLQRAVDIAPDSPKVRQNLGLLYLKTKQFDKAAATFHQVLELESSYPETNYYIGLIHEMRGDEKTAQSFYVRDVNNGPSQAWDRLIVMKRRQRRQGRLPQPPARRHVVTFSLVLLGVAACAYGLRLYLDHKRHATDDWGG